MSYPVSKTQLIASIRQRTNTEGATDFCDDIEIGGYLNSAIAAWWDIVLGATWGGDRYQRQHVFATVDGQELYERPKDLYKILSVDLSQDESFSPSSPCWSAYPYQKEERNRIRGPANFAYPWTYNARVFYRWVDKYLSFLPIPDQVFYVRLNYAPTPPLLESAEDTFDSVAGWEEYLVLHASIRVLTKCGPYATIPVLQQQLAEEAARIKAYAPTADTNQAERIHILEDYCGYDMGSDGWGPNGGGWSY